ncbi:caspase family protein [bacterium]|nr:caspase family protein [bacterium]
MKRFAILLGSEEYKDFLMTKYCHNDVNNLKETLITCCDYLEQDVYSRLLTPEDEIHPLEILKEVEKLLEKSQEGDSILFYYSGHGALIENEGYLILSTTSLTNIQQTSIPIRDINEVLKKDGRLCVRIFDACHSGIDIRDSTLNPTGFIREILSSTNEGWATLAACKENEGSYPDDSIESGVFSYYLCEAIREYKNGDEIYPEELKIKICRGVEKWLEDKPYIQTPTLNSSISGNVPIAVRKVIVEDTQENGSEIEDPQNDELISSTLEVLHEYAKRGITANKENYEQQINLMKSIFNDTKKENALLTDAEVIVSDSESIPAYLKRLIVRKFDDLGLKSSFDIRIVRIYEEENPIFKRIMGGLSTRKIEEIKYIIKQPYDYPDSFIQVKVKQQGFIPSGLIFCFIIPLQMKIWIIAGYSMGDRDIWSDRSNEIISANKLDYKCSDRETVKALADLLIRKFKDKYLQKCKQREKYLENKEDK